MEELQLAVTTSRVDQRNSGLWINNWQVGQSLNALVTNQLPSGELVLRVGAHRLTATSDIPIQQGARLQLEVKSLDPMPTLRVMNAVDAQTTAAQSATLRLLPAAASGTNPIPAAAVMQSVQNAQAALPLPPAVAASVDELLRLANRPERLSSAEGVSRAVRDSGVFLEARLASPQGPPRGSMARDVKAGVMRSLASTEAALNGVEGARMGAADAEALAELKRELEAGLGRINLNQIASQTTEGQPRSWQLDIPVYGQGSYHNLNLRIDEGDTEGQRKEGDDEPRPWRVRMEVAPPGLGPMEMNLEVSEAKVRVEFAAARRVTRALLDGTMRQLEFGLNSRGLRFEGLPSRPIDPAPVRGGVEEAARAVDVKA
ncbi:MAG: flagellar hook-length control protein FliK [Halieaceae bacterium]|jgi:hypothetical protein|nr:flagellar hook-length control protein FliK [Halieaceae bacterium]